MPAAYICDGLRTPIGRYGGVLAGIRTDDLAAIPLAALRRRFEAYDWAAVDEVVYGCANQAGEDCRNVARMASLIAGLPPAVPATTVNRLCGSGMDAIIILARAIGAGELSLGIAGGVESMSRAPLVIPKASKAFSRRAEIFDTTIGWRFTNPAIASQYGAESMPETAENVAAAYGIPRAAQDAFAWRSQQRAEAARTNGFFAGEIVQVTLPNGTEVAEDEPPRPGVTLETLARLPTPFRPGGTVTAGNSSGINDGACAVFVASEKASTSFGLHPLARIVASATAGVLPSQMGIGPVPAIGKLLARQDLTVADIDWWEIDEAFAAQVLAVTRALGLADDSERVNPNGGAIALGHPLGMSGARLVLTAARQLQRIGDRYAIAAMSVGLGQGIATLLERV